MQPSIVRECPWCRYKADAATAPSEPDTSPEDGHISICIACIRPSFFTDSTTQLRKPTAIEGMQLLNDPEYVNTIAVLAMMKNESGDRWPSSDTQ